ncbi:molybdopterin-dependent oxidoreductase [Nocardia sp. SYP-A9097]|uniref:sulfite oxidase n=1 Tax=Nocardia sp. SYP-A9097 TaxID=2663237 RepID=UPI00129BBC84|nr:sulfite oxidase [Nocardia sp. SYP-A9097]MRH89454.1 molybdopterin-dependent oxidoreductase [Nocardia sp. SYP-A9097]
MGPRIGEVSAPGRLADPGEGISGAELALAACNHGLPLEALRYDVTPPGLHYVLTHYDIPATDDTAWQLVVGGAVRSPRAFGVGELREFDAETYRVTMECAGNGRARLTPRPISHPWLVEAVGTADWTGVPLRVLLDEVGLDPEAVDIVFTGADHGVERGVEQDYERSLPPAIAVGDDPPVLVAYEMNGHPLPPQHGSPVRLIVPGWYGMASVKWLRAITAITVPFTGFQQAVAYRVRSTADEQGDPVTRIAPRSLILPPGFPDFMSRDRVVRPGHIRVEGRAWSGNPPITRVEFSSDGGRTWSDGELAAPDHPWSWRRWHFDWTATPGTHTLCSRATDYTGVTQPIEQAWNRGGYANNAAQQVLVHCIEAAVSDSGELT